MVQVKPIQGVKKVLFFQAMDDTTTDGSGLRLAFQTEHTLTQERETIEELTKDGNIKDAGDINASLSFTSYVAKNDPTFDLLQEAFNNNETLQVWEVDLTEKDEGETYDSLYAQGKLTSFEVSNSADGFSELSTELAINLIPQKGPVTVSEAQFDAVQYAFKAFGELAKENAPETP